VGASEFGDSQTDDEAFSVWPCGHHSTHACLWMLLPAHDVKPPRS
jgi:hypothetical protein